MGFDLQELQTKFKIQRDYLTSLVSDATLLHKHCPVILTWEDVAGWLEAKRLHFQKLIDYMEKEC